MILIFKQIKLNHLKTSGFSLVELLVVVSIVAVMSISSVVGFGYLGDILKAREVTSFLNDLVKQEELKVLRGDFDKAVIHFLPNFVAIEEGDDQSNPLLLKIGSSCIDGYNIDYQDGNLTQKNGEGEVIRVSSVSAASECIDFVNSEDVEWNYQLSNGDLSSNVVRFIHFNLSREDADRNPISIITGANSRMEILAPYGKKYIYYYNSDTLVESLLLTVEDSDQNSSDSLTFQ